MVVSTFRNIPPFDKDSVEAFRQTLRAKGCLRPSFVRRTAWKHPSKPVMTIVQHSK